MRVTVRFLALPSQAFEQGPGSQGTEDRNIPELRADLQASWRDEFGGAQSSK